ncbi:MAG: phage holin family protein [Frankia sp.]|nr:phage holin family protein [Frankia sp.]
MTSSRRSTPAGTAPREPLERVSRDRDPAEGARGAAAGSAELDQDIYPEATSRDRDPQQTPTYDPYPDEPAYPSTTDRGGSQAEDADAFPDPYPENPAGRADTATRPTAGSTASSNAVIDEPIITRVEDEPPEALESAPSRTVGAEEPGALPGGGWDRERASGRTTEGTGRYAHLPAADLAPGSTNGGRPGAGRTGLLGRLGGHGRGGGGGATRERPSTGQLVSGVAADLSTLMRQEVQLAKAEMRQSAMKAGKGVGALGGAAGAAVFGVLFLLLALMFGLATVMAIGFAALLVGGVLLVVAAVMALVGRQMVKKVHPAPTQTVETLKEDIQWAHGLRK